MFSRLGNSESGPAPGEVEKMNPDFVLWTKEGKSYRARHDAAKAMLLNEGTESGICGG